MCPFAARGNGKKGLTGEMVSFPADLLGILITILFKPRCQNLRIIYSALFTVFHYPAAGMTTELFDVASVCLGIFHCPVVIDGQIGCRMVHSGKLCAAALRALEPDVFIVPLVSIG